jgi:hypothetical protein
MYVSILFNLSLSQPLQPAVTPTAPGGRVSDNNSAPQDGEVDADG